MRVPLLAGRLFQYNLFPPEVNGKSLVRWEKLAGKKEKRRQAPLRSHRRVKGEG
jgi:hypothetical protein